MSKGGEREGSKSILCTYTLERGFEPLNYLWRLKLLPRGPLDDPFRIKVVPGSGRFLRFIRGVRLSFVSGYIIRQTYLYNLKVPKVPNLSGANLPL